MHVICMQAWPRWHTVGRQTMGLVAGSCTCTCYTVGGKHRPLILYSQPPLNGSWSVCSASIAPAAERLVACYWLHNNWSGIIWQFQLVGSSDLSIKFLCEEEHPRPVVFKQHKWSNNGSPFEPLRNTAEPLQSVCIISIYVWNTWLSHTFSISQYLLMDLVLI